MEAVLSLVITAISTGISFIVTSVNDKKAEKIKRKEVLLTLYNSLNG